MKKILILILAVLIGLGIFRDAILKFAISAVSSRVIGAPVQMDGFRLGLLKQSVQITGLRIKNPKGFSDASLADIEKIIVAIDAKALLLGKIHVKEAQFALKEMTLETNKQGRLNVDSLKVAQQATASKEKTKPAGKPMPLQIDLLKLKIGKFVMKDYSVSGAPAIKVSDIHIDKTYRNIGSVQQLAALILSEPMKSAGIQGAAIYGAAMMTGVGIVPVAIASAFIGKDSVGQSFDYPLEEVYAAGLAVLKEMGKVGRDDPARVSLTGNVKGASVTLAFKKAGEGKTEVTVSARKYMLPEPSVAAGVLYKMAEQLK